MNHTNFNHTTSDLDTDIYRIIPFDRITEILISKSNFLVRPMLWEDPFENLISLYSSRLGYNELQWEKFYVYAQCWTFNVESDLMWRTYSDSKDFVKIKSTPAKLISSLVKSKILKDVYNNPSQLHDWYDEEDKIQTIHSSVESFSGKMKYLTHSEIALYMNQFLKGNSNGLDPLFIKRESFADEREFRIGIRHFFSLTENILDQSDSVFRYDIDVNSVFDELVFDPRISRYKFEGLKSALENLGFKNPITKSTLYEIPTTDQILLG